MSKNKIASSVDLWSIPLDLWKFFGFRSPGKFVSNYKLNTNNPTISPAEVRQKLPRVGIHASSVSKLLKSMQTTRNSLRLGDLKELERYNAGLVSKKPVLDARFKERVDFIQDCYVSFSCSLISALSARPKTDRRTKQGMKRVSSYVTFMMWLARLGINSGIDILAKELKKAFNECRLAVFENRKPLLVRPLAELFKSWNITSDERLLSVSFASRALPFASKRAVEDAIKTHQATYASGFDTPLDILDEVREFGRSLGEELQDPLRVFEPTLTEGACLEFSRREGGLGKYLRELYQSDEYSLRRSSYEVNGERPDGWSFESWCSYTSGARMRDMLLRDLRQVGAQAKIEIVLERGFKTRVVTKSPGSLVSLSHFLRTEILSRLRRVPEASAVLRGERRGAVAEMFPVENIQRLIVSADLTAASDRLPHDLVQVLWSGILSTARWPKWAEEVVALNMGSQQLTYPDGSVVRSKKGILMGLPLTWVTLSLVHLFWVKLAQRRVGTLLPQPFRICGDDMIGVWTRKMLDAYDQIVVSSGGKFSVGKHYVSSHYGVFTEEIFLVVRQARKSDRVRERTRKAKSFFPTLLDAQQFVRRNKRKGDVEPLSLIKRDGSGDLIYRKKKNVRVMETRVQFGMWTDAFPIKGLVGRPSNQPNTSKLVPWWSVVGPSASQICEMRPHRTRVVSLILEFSHPGIYRWANSRGLYPVLPRELGGFGLPPRNSQEKRCVKIPRLARKALGVLLYATKRTKKWNDIQEPWVLGQKNPIRDMAVQFHTDVPVPEGVLVRKNKQRFPPGYLRMEFNYWDFEQWKIGHLERSLDVLGVLPHSHSARDVSTWLVATSISGCFRALVASCPTHPGLRPSAPFHKLLKRYKTWKGMYVVGQKALQDDQIAKILLSAGASLQAVEYSSDRDEYLSTLLQMSLLRPSTERTLVGRPFAGLPVELPRWANGAFSRLIGEEAAWASPASELT